MGCLHCAGKYSIIRNVKVFLQFLRFLQLLPLLSLLAAILPLKLASAPITPEHAVGIASDFVSRQSSRGHVTSRRMKPQTAAQNTMQAAAFSPATGGQQSESPSLSLSLTGTAGSWYNVERTYELNNPQWEIVESFIVPSTGARSVSLPVEYGADSAFYRVVPKTAP